MNAELMIRFRKFPQDSQRRITKALSNQCKHDSHGYKQAIKGLPKDGLQWLVDYETGLLNGGLK